MLMFGDAMSMRARSTCAPSSNSPARMRAKRSRFSSTRPAPIRTVGARLGQGAPELPNLLGGEAVDIRQPIGDEVHRVVVELLEVVGGVPGLSAPPEPEPAHVFADRFRVFDVLFRWIGVVEPEVARPAELPRDAEIEANRFRVPDVEVPVRLGWKAGDDPAVVPAGPDIVGHGRTNEVDPRRGIAFGGADGRVRAVPVHGVQTSIIAVSPCFPRVSNCSGRATVEMPDNM